MDIHMFIDSCLIGIIYDTVVNWTGKEQWVAIKLMHSEMIFLNYSCIGACLVSQNTVAEIWSNAW